MAHGICVVSSCTKHLLFLYYRASPSLFFNLEIALRKIKTQIATSSDGFIRAVAAVSSPHPLPDT